MAVPRRSLALARGIAVAAAALAVIPALLAAQQAPPNSGSGRAAWMTHHFADIVTMHDAVVRGDLAAARAMASHVQSEADPLRLNDAGRARLERLRALAADVAAAGDIATAANATAGIVSTCGDCHEATGVRMPPPPESETAEPGGVVGHMVEHQRALRSMLAGLMVPSTSEWQSGARRLEGAALPKQALPNDHRLTGRITAADHEVHALSGQAIAAQSTDERVAVYGKLLVTCATCHSLHPTVWGPVNK
jgi:hypothetical protein